jgi:hypothetical protein
MKSFLGRLGKRGQATVEYILILSIAVGFTLFVVNTLLKPKFLALQNRISGAIDGLLSSADLHHINLGSGQ